jgi:hypothetical protein
VNEKEKAAKAKLAGKRVDDGYGGKVAFHVTKKGAKDIDTAIDDGDRKVRRRFALPKPSDFKRGKQ